MGVGYELAYRFHVTPWERAGQEATTSFAQLLDREEAERTPPLGRALDLGCGSGLHTIELAQRGWDATGIDLVHRAVEQARHRPGAERATFVEGDVTRLESVGIEGEIDFFLDVGCFHGLTDEQRTAYGRGVTALAGPSATLLVLSFVPGRRRMLPRGASQADIERALPGWQVVNVEDADTTGMPGPLKKTAPRWYRLARR